MSHTRRRFLQFAAAAASSVVIAGRRLAATVATAAGWPPDAALLAADPLRPQYHLLPKFGWMNDPNAPVYWHGRYHMFFQYNPGAAVWGDMHWDHAVSSDMVHWQHLPVALAPTPGGYDADGCFTGSFVDATGLGLPGDAAIIYTGVQAVSNRADVTLSDGVHLMRETQDLATTSDPLLRTWNKLPAPVLPNPPKGLDIAGFRDPSIWKQDGSFYMTVGSGVRQKGGCVLLYKSPGSGPQALRAWQYLHPLYEGKWNGKATPDSVDSGEMWECPEFFALGDRHVLIYSTERKVYWVSGHLDAKTMTFEKHRQGLLDGGAYYAPKTQLDAQGRRILWGWIPETRPDDALKAAGWAGCMSLPRVLGLDAAGNLTMTPAPEVEQLRSAADGASRPPYSCFELQATLTGTAPRLTLLDDTTSQPWLEVAVRGSGEDRELVAQGKSVPLPRPVSSLAKGDESDLALRIFVDASVVEIFADHGTCLTVRVYRPLAGTLSVHPDPSMVKDLHVWPLMPISQNRLTT